MGNYFLFKSLVGSHAHGLAREDSDVDYRGVYVKTTDEILALGPKLSMQSWSEGDEEDSVMFEIGHFLFLATKSNPSILEIFKGPNIKVGWGGELPWLEETLNPLRLFDDVWSSKGVYDSHRGYGLNQRKKLLDDPYGPRARKYACAWLRALYNATCLLKEGDFSMNVIGTPIERTLRDWRNEGLLSVGEAVDVCLKQQDELEKAYAANPDKETNLTTINEFLFELREFCWNDESANRLCGLELLS